MPILKTRPLFSNILLNSRKYEQIAMHNSSYENDIRRQQIKENGVSTANRGANLHPYRRNTPYINCRMITGDKISPFPRDSYSAEDGY